MSCTSCCPFYLAVVAALLLSCMSSISAEEASCLQTSSRKLLRWLGHERRVALKSFTPLSLCLKNMKDSRRDVQVNGTSTDANSYRSSLTSSTGLSVVSVEDWTENHGTDLDLVAGCTATDLQQLIAIQPAQNSMCSWSLRCQYDADRFPSVLYSAQTKFTSEIAQSQCFCVPVQRDVWVLRRRRIGACKVWSRIPQLERVVVGYDCYIGLRNQ